MGGSPAPPKTYQLANQPQMDTSVTGDINKLSTQPNYGQDIWNTMSPELLALAGPTGYDPTAPVKAGQNVISAQAGLPGYEQQVLSDAFDPQKALYARTAQQTQQQTRAALEARGVDSTPYGAGVEGDTMSNFNIDWLNNQLNREATGVTAATTLADEYGKANATGIGLETIAPNLQGAAVSSLEGAAQGASALPQQVIDDRLKYLNQGNANASTATNAYAAESAASAQGLGGIGSAIGTIGGIFAGK